MPNPRILFTLSLLCLSVALYAQPTFTQVFSPNQIGPGSASKLTYTIDNVGGLTVTDLAFANTLPGAITLAIDKIENTCDGTVTASAGGSTISLSDGKLSASGSCQISVYVTSSTVGTHTNTTGDLTSSAGNSGTSTDDLEVIADRPGFTQSFSPSTVSLGQKSRLTYTVDNSTNTNGVFGLLFQQDLPPGLEVADPMNAISTCGSDLILTATGFELPFPPFLPTAVLDAGKACTISLDVVARASGSFDVISDALQARSQFFQILGSSGISVSELEVTVPPTLHIEKQFIGDPLLVGGTGSVEYTIKSFDRSSTITDIAFTDDLDGALSGLVATGLPISGSCGTGSMVAGTSTITLTDGELAPGGSCTFSVPIQVPGGAATGAYPSTSSAVTGTKDGAMITGDMATDALHIAPVPVLTKEFLDPITMMPVSSVGAGKSVKVRFTIQNTSTTDQATDIAFNDIFSASIGGSVLSSIPVAGSCGAGSFFFTQQVSGQEQFSMTGGTLAGGGSCTFDVEQTMPSATNPATYDVSTESISATIDGATVVGQPAQSQIEIIGAPRLSMDFTNDPVLPGDMVNLRYEISHSEFAADPATNVSFTHNLNATAAGLVATGLPISSTCGMSSALSGTNFLTFADGEIAPGDTCKIDVALQVPASATIGDKPSSTSMITANVGGVSTMRDGAQSTLQIGGVTFTKEYLDDPVIPGGKATLRFTIENNSVDDFTNMVFTDNLSSSLSGLITTGTLPTEPCGTGSMLSGTSLLIMTVGNVTAGNSCTFDVEVMVPAAAADGDYGNTTSNLTLTANGNSIVANPATDVLRVQKSMLEMSKSFSRDLVAPGDQVDIEFVIKNLSTSEATAVMFSDDLDAMISGYAASGLPQSNVCGTGSMISGTGEVTLTDGMIAAGDSCKFSITTTVPSSAAGGIYTNTTSVPTGMITGLAVDGNAASDEVQIGAAEFTKSFSGPAKKGGTVDLTFKIKNGDSSNPLSQLRFSDNLDAVLSGLVATGLPMSDVCGSGSEVSGTDIITLSGGSIPAGDSCEFAVTLSIPDDAEMGTYTNETSKLSTAGLDINEIATADLVIEPEPTFAKAFGADTIVSATLTTLTFTIDNSASALGANDLSFQDTLPDGLHFVGTQMSDCGGMVQVMDTVLTLTGGSVTAGSSCTVTVPVFSDSLGQFINKSSHLYAGAIISADPAIDTIVYKCPETLPLTITGENVCPEGEISLSATSIAAVSWSWTGPDMYSSTDQNITIENAASSNSGYYVLTITDKNGCMHKDSINITVYDLPNVDAGMDDSYCEDSRVVLRETGGDATSWSWTGPNENRSTADSLVIENLTAADAGEYIVTVTDANMCMNVDTVEVGYNALPDVIVDSNTPVCPMTDINLTESSTTGASWAWSGPNSFSSTDQNPTISNATEAMEGEYKVIVRDANECADSSTTIVIVQPVSLVEVSSDTTICMNDGVTLSESGGDAVSWEWSGPGMYSAMTQDIMIMDMDASKVGYYKVQITDDNGCEFADSVLLQMNSLPVVDAGMDFSACEASTAMLNESGGEAISWSWTGSNGFTSDQQAPSVDELELMDEGEYIVLGTDANGCSDMDTVSLMIDPLPIISGVITGPEVICPSLDDLPYTISPAMHADIYVWEYAGVAGTEIYNGISATLGGVTAGGELSVYAQNACGSSTDTLTLMIELGDEELCALADCLRENMSIDDELLALTNAIDIFRAQNDIYSDATIKAGKTKIFIAGNSITLFGADPASEFEVELGATFIAQIESCVRK